MTTTATGWRTMADKLLEAVKDWHDISIQEGRVALAGNLRGLIDECESLPSPSLEPPPASEETGNAEKQSRALDALMPADPSIRQPMAGCEKPLLERLAAQPAYSTAEESEEVTGADRAVTASVRQWHPELTRLMWAAHEAEAQIARHRAASVKRAVEKYAAVIDEIAAIYPFPSGEPCGLDHLIWRVREGRRLAVESVGYWQRRTSEAESALTASRAEVNRLREEVVEAKERIKRMSPGPHGIGPG